MLAAQNAPGGPHMSCQKYRGHSTGPRRTGIQTVAHGSAVASQYRVLKATIRDKAAPASRVRAACALSLKSLFAVKTDAPNILPSAPFRTRGRLAQAHARFDILRARAGMFGAFRFWSLNMDLELADKVAIITGASRGIGKAIA